MSYNKYIINAPMETSEASIYKTNNPERPTNHKEKPQNQVYNSTEVINDLLSDGSFDANDLEDESFEGKSYDSKVPMYGGKDGLNEKYHFSQGFATHTIQNSDVVGQADERLDSLSLTIHKGWDFKKAELMNIAGQLKINPQRTKFVYLSFRTCTWMNDSDLANIGVMLGSRLGGVEYLSLDFQKSRRSVSGIQKLIKGVSGQENTIKSLRIRMRKHRHLGNESARDMIKGIRASLVNLEELSIVFADNLWISSSGVNGLKDEVRVIEGLGLGLKKYEIKYLSVFSLGQKDTAKDMSRYIMERFGKMGVKEAMLVSNKMRISLKKIESNKMAENKIIIRSSMKM